MKKYKHKVIILFILLLLSNLTQAENYRITICGDITKSIGAKEITFRYWEELLDRKDPMQEHKTVKAEVVNGKFKIIIYPQKPNIYINFGWRNYKGASVMQLNPYLFIGETNDNIFVKIDTMDAKYKLTFSGVGAAKYNCVQELSNASNSFKPTKLVGRDGNPISEFNYQKNYHHELINEQMKTVEKYKNELSSYSYELYKTDALYNILYYYLRQLSLLYQYNKSQEMELTSLVSGELDWISNFRSDSALSFTTKVFENSAFLPAALVDIAKLKADLHRTPVMKVLINEKNAVIRDRIIAQYFVRFSKNLFTEVKEKLYNQIMIVINDSYCRAIIDSSYKNTAIGAKVYNFHLPDTNGKIVRLSDFKGKVVFIDFWFVGCGGCAQYYRDIVKPVELKYKNVEDIIFIAVSIDTDTKKWTNGIKSGKFTSEEIINLHCPDGAENPIIKQFSITAYPHPLIIDRDGKIFNDSTKELRLDGIESLVKALEKALNKKEARTAL